MGWGDSLTHSLLEDVRELHAGLVQSVEDLGEERFHARPGPKAPSIAFHLWHVGRWADLFQSGFPTFSKSDPRDRQQLWVARELPAAWDLAGPLGVDDSGMGLDDDASASLRLPEMDAVLGYARGAFDACEEVFATVHDADLLDRTGNLYDDDEWIVLDHFLWHAGHGGRHLGMIEALKGVLGVRGTVTT
jgi:DinB family protein